MNLLNVSLEVLVGGSPLHEYTHGGQTFVEGTSGRPYLLRIRNSFGNGRILMVPTVDGLSTMDGKDGSVYGGGYVLNEGDMLDVPGWRLDDQKVAAFEFGWPGEGYAPKIGKPQNVGVIGLACFKEKVNVYVHDGNYRGMCRMMSFGPEKEIKTAGGIYASPAKNELSTKFGAELGHNVRVIDFKREDKPFVTIALNYDSREGLLARGIRFEAEASNPFPADKAPGCTPPTGWRG